MRVRRRQVFWCERPRESSEAVPQHIHDDCAVTHSFLTDRCGTFASIHFLTIRHSNWKSCMLNIQLWAARYSSESPSRSRKSGYSIEVLWYQPVGRSLCARTKSMQGSPSHEFVRLWPQAPTGCGVASLELRDGSRGYRKFVWCQDLGAASFHDSDLHTYGSVLCRSVISLLTHLLLSTPIYVLVIISYIYSTWCKWIETTFYKSIHI